MDFETIEYFEKDQIARILLSRPSRMNSVNEKMMQEILAALDDLNKKREAKVLVLTGAGNAFCTGADLGDDDHQYPLFRESSPDKIMRNTRHVIQKITLGLHTLDIPTIASINGYAMGAGFDWSLACDIRIGSPKAKFRLGTRIGLVHGTGGTWLLPRIVGLPKALELFYTGRFIEADEALSLGILNKLVDPSSLETETMNMAGEIAAGPAIQIRLHKLLIQKGLNMDLATALDFAAAAIAIDIPTAEFKEGLRAFREKRAPNFRDP